MATGEADAVKNLLKVKLTGGQPNIENSSSVLQYSIAQNVEYNQIKYCNAKAFSISEQIQRETQFVQEMEEYLKDGKKHMYMLYTFRSGAKAFSVIEKQNSSADAAARKAMYRCSFDVLEVQMQKIFALLKFQERLVNCIVKNIERLSSNKKLVTFEATYSLIIHLIDLVLRLDNLKDMKACLRNDFALYKRSHHFVKDDVKDKHKVADEVHDLQMFLADPRCPKMIILNKVRTQIRAFPNHVDVMTDLFTYCIQQLDKEIHIFPEEKWRLIRFLPHVMFILDDDNDDKGSFNVFKSKKFNNSTVQKIFKRYPIVPIFGDMHIDLVYILSMCHHYDRHLMEANFVESDLAKTQQKYHLTSHWKNIRFVYDKYVAEFTILLNKVKLANKKDGIQHKDYSFDLMINLYDSTLKGIKLLASWQELVSAQLAYKYANPVDDAHMHEMKADFSKEGIEYERVIRYNYSQTELNVLIDVVTLIKSLACIMNNAEALIAPVLRLYIHKYIQDFTREGILDMLHRADKRNRPVKDVLLQVRGLLSDWANGVAPVLDYQAGKKTRKASEAVNQRCLAPSPTQLHLLKCIIESLYHGNAVSMQSRGLFTAKDFDKSEVETLQAFHRKIFDVPYLLDFGGTIRECSDLSDLWYREFYLEVTKCVQFPIASSLPWIIIKEMIDNPSSIMIGSILYALDIYNDAAHFALHELKQQFIYDEIEAEVSLVFEQLVFLLSNHLYQYYKSVAASQFMDKEYRDKLNLEVEKRRYEIPMSQRHIQLLGRSIDLNYLIAQNLNTDVKTDIDVVISRFESQYLSGIMELGSALRVVKETHSLLSEIVELDDFDKLLNEANAISFEDLELGNETRFTERIVSHCHLVILDDLLPKYIFNHTTERFVSPYFNENDIRGSKFKVRFPKFGYGSECGQAYYRQHQLQNSFIGKPHVEEMVKLLGKSMLSVLIDEMMNDIEEKLASILGPYSVELTKGLPPLKLPKLAQKNGACYAYFETILMPILEYPHMKSVIFQTFREIGNAIALARLIQSALDKQDVFTFIQAAPFVGLTTLDRLGAGPDVVEPPHAHETPLAKSISSYFQATRGDKQNLVNMAQEASAGYVAVNRRIPLFRTVLQRLALALDRTVREQWSMPDNSTDEDIIINTEASKQFYRLWSALQFMYCMPDKQEKEIRDDYAYGDGFAWAGCTFIHLLDQRNRFDMLDYAYHVLRVYYYEHSALGFTTAKAGDVDVNTSQSAAQFIKRVQAIRNANEDIFSILQNALPNDSQDLLIFKPPVDDNWDAMGLQDAAPVTAIDGHETLHELRVDDDAPLTQAAHPEVSPFQDLASARPQAPPRRSVLPGTPHLSPDRGPPAVPLRSPGFTDANVDSANVDSANVNSGPPPVPSRSPVGQSAGPSKSPNGLPPPRPARKHSNRAPPPPMRSNRPPPSS